MDAVSRDKFLVTSAELDQQAISGKELRQVVADTCRPARRRIRFVKATNGSRAQVPKALPRIQNRSYALISTSRVTSRHSGGLSDRAAGAEGAFDNVGIVRSTCLRAIFPQ
jgi:hypothetical protein